MKEKVCAVCSKPYLAPNKASLSRYCSRVCALVNARSCRKSRKMGGVRERPCMACGEPFQYEIARGVDRRYCSEPCKKRGRASRQLYRQATANKCLTEGCSNRASYSDGICNSCFYRRRRTGTTDIRQWAYRYRNRHGYIFLYDPSHPLAGKEGHLYEHRAILYASLGEGPQSCYWCSKELETWKQIVVDHLNEIKDDNRPENLVAACNDCNRARGSILPFLARLNDISFQAFTRAAAEYRTQTAELNKRDHSTDITALRHKGGS